MLSHSREGFCRRYFDSSRSMQLSKPLIWSQDASSLVCFTCSDGQCEFISEISRIFPVQLLWHRNSVNHLHGSDSLLRQQWQDAHDRQFLSCYGQGILSQRWVWRYHQLLSYLRSSCRSWTTRVSHLCQQRRKHWITLYFYGSSFKVVLGWLSWIQLHFWQWLDPSNSRQWSRQIFCNRRKDNDDMEAL